MITESIKSRVLHLAEVEKLTQRQIAVTLGISRNQVQQIMKSNGVVFKHKGKPLMLEAYRDLISQWYLPIPISKGNSSL